jgi:hypothetical protein
MDEPYPSGSSARRRPSVIRIVLGTALAAFLLGGVATWLLVSSADGERRGFLGLGGSDGEVVEPAAGPTQAPGVSAEAPAEEANRPPADPGSVAERIAAMEQRLARLDFQASAAAGNASRAESLLIAFASRRAIERGAPLGYLEDQLRLRFGEARPNAVDTVIATGREPVTLDQLLTRLDGLAPRLSGGVREGAFGWLKRELGDLFVVRRVDAPSPAPERRLERARLFLESGRAGAAAAEIRNLPNAEVAADWIADAERYSSTQRALELLELTAILDPSELRDAEGGRITQPSAAAAR